MNRTPSLPRPAAMAIALAAASLCPLPLLAQTTPEERAAPSTGADTIRLSDAQRDKILDESTEDSAAAARGELTGPERVARGIHGEVGVMIGSNGTRGAFGAADIPLGDNAAASISVESSRIGFPQYRR